MADILKKQIKPHIELVVTDAFAFSVRITGVDPLRPEQVKPIIVSSEIARMLLDYEWDAIELPKK